MRSAMLTLTLSFAALSPNSCTPEQVDSFCQLYTRVIVEKGDGSIAAPTSVKRRLLANELLYKQQCAGKA